MLLTRAMTGLTAHTARVKIPGISRCSDSLYGVTRQTGHIPLASLLSKRNPSFSVGTLLPVAPGLLMARETCLAPDIGSLWKGEKGPGSGPVKHRFTRRSKVFRA